MSQIERVAVLGSGRMGKALAVRLANAGHRVTLGSRKGTVAEEASRQLNASLAGPAIASGDHSQALSAADIVILAIPYQAQAQALEALRQDLRGMILVTAVVALDTGSPKRVSLPPGRSAAIEAQDLLGPDIPVVAAFQTLMYRVLSETDKSTLAEVWVAGDDPAARRRVVELSTSTGLTTRDIGPLANSIACEALTSIIMKVGAEFGAKRIGVRLTGVGTEGGQS